MPAAYAQTGSGAVVTLFPLRRGKTLDIRLPAGLQGYNLISFGPDGRSVYLQMPHPGPAEGLVKIELEPLRREMIRGSAGLGDIWFLTTSDPARLYVSASGGRDRQCGAYEIETEKGTVQPLRIGVYPHCGGAVGPISADGRRLLRTAGERLEMLDLTTGAVKPIGNGRGAWSPDGRWIASYYAGQISLIDPQNPSSRKTIRRSSVDGHLVWSPDSRYILTVVKDVRCFLLGDIESLAAVDISAGEYKIIGSGHCGVTNSNVGWLEASLLQ